MSRRPKRPASPAPPAVLIVCTDAHHRDEPGFAERGYHLVGEIRHAPERQGGLAWSGHAPEQGALRTSGITLLWGVSRGVPVKRYRRDDGQPTYRVRCRCGLDVERSEPDLAEIVTAWGREFPGRPVEVDVCRLQRRARVRLPCTVAPLLFAGEPPAS
jgi:hypothetical protein